MILLDISPVGQALLWFLAWAVGAVVASQIIYWVWNRGFLRLAGLTRTDLDETILLASRGPVRAITLILILYIGTHASMSGVEAITRHPAWTVWLGILYIAVVLGASALVYAVVSSIAGWYCRKAAEHTSQTLGDQFLSVSQKVAKFVVLFVALTIVFDHFGVQITGLLATAGVASLAVAFAAQETLANTISGFVLMVDRPFKAGDRIQLADGQMGDVLDVGLRSTRILSFDNTVITIPNSTMAKSEIINLNAPNANVKIRCTLGVAYGTDLRQVKTILLDIMQANPDVLKEPAPAVFFSEFAESSLNLLFVCWVADYRDKFRILDELNMAIKDRFEAENIQIPFPQREVHVRMVQT